MNRKLKILFLSTGTGVGGGEMQITMVGSRLRARGHEVMIVSMSEIGMRGEQARNAGVTVASLGLRRGASLLSAPAAMLGMLAILRRWQPDVLVSFMFYANLLGRLAGFVARIPVIVTSVRSERFGGQVHFALLRLTDRLGDVTVTNSVRVAKLLTARRITPPKRLKVVPNGISTECYGQGVPERDRVCEAFFAGRAVDYLWIAVGRLHESKGYPVLLDAFCRLAASCPGAHLLIAGDGPHKDALAAQANDLAIAGRVCLAGERQDVPILLSAADSLVLPSLWEGLPNAVMEAMASGLPVVASDVGGVRELLGDNVCGYVVPPDDPAALAAAMQEMMALPAADRRRMGNAGRALIANRYELARVTEAWEQLFYEVSSD